MQFGHGHAAWTWTNMEMSIQPGHGHAAWTWSCSLDMVMQPEHAARTWSMGDVDIDMDIDRDIDMEMDLEKGLVIGMDKHYCSVEPANKIDFMHYIIS
jgi:hypothetical protein